VNCIGGFIKNRAGFSFFRILFEPMKKPWLKKDLNRAPDLSYMDANDRVYFEQTSPEDFVQISVHHKPRIVEKSIGELTIEELKNRFGSAIFQRASDEQEIKFEHDGRDYKVCKNVNIDIEGNPLRDTYELILVHDLYYEPVSAEKKTLAINMGRDISDALGQKESWIGKIAPYALAVIMIITWLIGFAMIKG
jgi:hypothetical protein